MESPSPGLRSNVRGRPSGIFLVLATILVALILTAPAASADDFDPLTEEELPLLAADNLVANIDESDVILEWTSPKSRVDSWIVTLNSTPVTSTSAEVHTAIVYDVDRTKSAVFSVIPVDKNGVQGPACITYLEPISEIALFELPEEVSDRAWEPTLPHGVEITSDTNWDAEGERTITLAPRTGLSFSDGQSESFTVRLTERTEAAEPSAPPEQSSPATKLSSVTGIPDSATAAPAKPGVSLISIVIAGVLLVGLGAGTFIYLRRRR